MFYSEENIIDNKIKQTFSSVILGNIKIDNLDYFGINISSDSNKDFAFKIYYKNKYSQELYLKSEKNHLIEFLIKNNLMNFLTVVHDKSHTDCSRYDVGLANQTNGKMELLFSYLKENCSFYKKYEKEILELSKMKATDMEDRDYRSFYFVALLDGGKTLKCHWLNRVYSYDTKILNNEYYINFIENSGVDGFKKILPIAKKIIKNCSADLWMEGIDYTEFGSKKHKIYLHRAEEVYEGLIKTYSDNQELQKKLKIIQEWNNLHQEIYCDGFAIGEDADNNSVINFYFRFKKTEFYK